MAPYTEIVIGNGQLRVWSNEWEIHWDNGHPRNQDGSRDARFTTYAGTVYSRTEIISLVDSLLSAWEEAKEFSRQFDSSRGIVRRGIPRVPLTIELINGSPALTLTDYGRLSSDSEVSRLQSELESLVKHADARMHEVSVRFYVPPIPAPTPDELATREREKKERYSMLREQALLQRGSATWNAEERTFMASRVSGGGGRSQSPAV
jgi:hypothetical protein